MQISKKMQEAFDEQINWEMWSANLYLQMAFWFRKEGWKGFAHWMYKQSAEETGHAMDMAEYVLNRGGHPSVMAIKEVPTEWTDPKAVFEAAYKHEQKVTELINKLADVAEAEKDRASINFVDRYIDEQVQEEQTAKDILNLFLHRDGHAVAQIDDKLGTRE
jgi:ferritin